MNSKREPPGTLAAMKAMAMFLLVVWAAALSYCNCQLSDHLPECWNSLLPSDSQSCFDDITVPILPYSSVHFNLTGKSCWIWAAIPFALKHSGSLAAIEICCTAAAYALWGLPDLGWSLTWPDCPCLAIHLLTNWWLQCISLPIAWKDQSGVCLWRATASNQSFWEACTHPLLTMLVCSLQQTAASVAAQATDMTNQSSSVTLQ